MKTEFVLDYNDAYPIAHGVINIIGKKPNDKPYLSVSFNDDNGQFIHGWVKDQDLERFAVNILKVLKSKKLK